jgi:MULE transposase domain
MVRKIIQETICEERLCYHIGVPVAWMFTPNATTDSIAFFLRWVKEASPEVRPAVIMTDRDQAQIAALQQVYPHSRILLCIWHVLRAMRCHFSIEAFQALWDKLKALVNTRDLAEFHKL